MKRNAVIDSAKGIGMISVIIGHSAGSFSVSHIRLGAFVYLYHIMLFFFVAGFLYDEKYNDSNLISVYIGKRLYGIWKYYIIYNAGFVFLHNVLSSLAITGVESYSFNESILRLTGGIVLQTNESMLGAFWFLPVLAVSSALFCTSFYLVSKVSGIFNNDKRIIVISIMSSMLLFATAGIYTNYHGIYLFYHMQTAFLAIPIMYFGWITKKQQWKIDLGFHMIGCLASCATLCLVVRFKIIP